MTLVPFQTKSQGINTPGGAPYKLDILGESKFRGGISATGDAIIDGHFSAATKAFLINHPTKEGQKLRHGAVEAPEWSVQIRGKTTSNVITLPDYWKGLVREGTVTVTLTPVGSFQGLYVLSQTTEKVEVGGVTGEYNYVVYGERLDVPVMEVEFEPDGHAL